MPEQYINVGISEQNMISAAAGLSLEGKIVFVYAIAPFITLRCYEQIKIDLCTMNLQVTLLGVGAGYSYDSAGPTHHAIEDVSIMRVLPNMSVWCPSTPVVAARCAEYAYKTPGPKYIRLERGKLPLLYDEKMTLDDGFGVLREGSDLNIIATGIMTHVALEASDKLKQHSVSAGVVDLYRIKPVDNPLFENIIKRSKRLITLEEHLITGGIGSLVAEAAVDGGIMKPVRRLGIREDICFQYAKRKSAHEACRLDRSEE